jgi:predicted small lipoprotein YifL
MYDTIRRIYFSRVEIMKNLLIYALVGSLTLGLAACGQKGPIFLAPIKVAKIEARDAAVSAVASAKKAKRYVLTADENEAAVTQEAADRAVAAAVTSSAAADRANAAKTLADANLAANEARNASQEAENAADEAGEASGSIEAAQRAIVDAARASQVAAENAVKAAAYVDEADAAEAC